MTRGIFIAGNESALFSALAAETEKKVEQYAVSIIPNPIHLPERAGETKPGKGQIVISWNPGSPISSRTLILAVENRLGQINDALLVCSPPALYRSAEALTPAEIEAQVNNQIKGWFYLARELALYFRNRENGTLALVVPETNAGGGDSSADLLGAAAAASFRSLASGLLSSAGSAPFHILGFSSEPGREKDFAAWIYKTLDGASKKSSGKWHKFGKLNLFR
ncbi:MAG: hypothetical protein LBI14_05685 [Treponema sp.]|jgi:hypothetical protein|nr:hypothetical protein [Treponema sp.]